MVSAVLAISLVAAPSTWQAAGTPVTWTLSAHELRATCSGKPCFALSAFAKEFDSSASDLAKAPQAADWEMNESHQVLSVVGVLLSLDESNSGFTGGAHPYAGALYRVIDPSKPKHPISLLDYFPEADVVGALRQDSFIAKHVDDPDAFGKAKTVSDLLNALHPDPDCVGFRDTALQAFAFHHLEGDHVAVRISFPYDSEVCRGPDFIVGVLLPIPPSLREPLARAASRQEGFLMKDAKAAKAPSVELHWSGGDAR